MHQVSFWMFFFQNRTLEVDGAKPNEERAEQVFDRSFLAAGVRALRAFFSPEAGFLLVISVSPHVWMIQPKTLPIIPGFCLLKIFCGGKKLAYASLQSSHCLDGLGCISTTLLWACRVHAATVFILTANVSVKCNTSPQIGRTLVGMPD